jgi:hypothetical protein
MVWNKVKKLGTKISDKVWTVAKSDQTMAVAKVAMTGIALIHSIEEYRRIKRPIGFGRR